MDDAVFNIGENGNLAGYPTHPFKKIDDWSGVQFTTDGVKTSLHFTKHDMQPEKQANTNMSKTKLTNGVLVVTISPNG